MRHRPCIAQSMITSKRLTRVLFVATSVLAVVPPLDVNRIQASGPTSCIRRFGFLRLTCQSRSMTKFLSTGFFFSGDAASRCSYHEACDEIMIALHQRGSGACRVILMARDPATPQTLSSHYAISIQTPFTIDSISQVIEDQCNETTQLVEADGKRKNEIHRRDAVLAHAAYQRSTQIRGKESDLPAVPLYYANRFT